MKAAPLALLAAALLELAPAGARAPDPPPAPGPAVSASPTSAPTTPPSSPQIALRLSYMLGPGAQRCPSEKAFRDEVAAKMGYDPFTTYDVPEAVVITL